MAKIQTSLLLVWIQSPLLGKKELVFTVHKLINEGRQSSTLKSYISAIKSKLNGDGYKWNEDLVLFSALTKACKLKNDTVLNRFPISIGLLEILLFELDRMIVNEN